MSLYNFIGGNEIKVNMSNTTAKEVSRLGGYSNHLKQWSESLKAKNPTFNHKTAFSTLMLANDESTKKYMEGFIKPLKTSLETYEKQLATVNPVDTARFNALQYKVNMAKADKTFMEAMMKNTAALFSESALGGMLKPNQQLTLPLQYLDAIQNTARHAVPFDATEVRTMIRQRVLRALIVDGQRYLIPDAYKDADLLRKILSSDTKANTKELTLTGKRAFNILDEAYAGVATKGLDKLNPLATIVSITVMEAGKEVKLTLPSSHNENVITYRLRGKYNLTVKSKDIADKIYQVAGDINFETGDLTVLKSSDDIVKMEIKTSLGGGNFPKTFTPVEVREDKDFVIDNQISAQFTWNPVDLQDKLTLENIDALMSATSVIYETATHLKDFYVFEELNTYYNILKDSDVYSNGNYEWHRIFEMDSSVAPNKDNVDNNGYRNTNPLEWRKTALGESIDIMTINMGLKLNVGAGEFTNVMWAHPLNSRLIGGSTMVFGNGESYGGVVPQVEVKVGTIAESGQVFRVVSTQRATQAVVNSSTKAVSKEIPSIAVSNRPEQETFKFWQWMTYFDQNGQIRNPNDLVHPTISYLDFFKLDMVHGIMGKLKLNNTEAFVPMAQGTFGVVSQ